MFRFFVTRLFQSSMWILFLACLGLCGMHVGPAWAIQSKKVSIQLATQSVGQTKRFALVIGNSAYQQVVALKNSINDANAVGERLRGDGYEVHLGLDLDRAGMNDALDGFLKRVEPGSEVLVYYAGHGIEVQGSNYLLPVDIAPMDVDQERRLRTDAVNVNDLLTDLQQRQVRVTLLIIDACRDNPFKVVRTRSLGGKSGLGLVEPPRGAFVIFSAGVGEQALDDLGPDDRDPNGLFTRKLLSLMDQNNLEIRSLATKLREEVRAAALTVQHQQFLGYYDQLIGEFYFRPPTMEPVAQNACDILVSPSATQDAILAADQDAALQACTKAANESPNEGRFTRLLIMAQENRVFSRAMASRDKAASAFYIEFYPKGRFIDTVRAHLVSLEPAPGPAPTPVVVRPAPTIDQPELTRTLQIELRRIGCYAGQIDGVWHSAAQKALRSFNQRAGATYNLKAATLEAVKGVQDKGEGFCPPAVVVQPPAPRPIFIRPAPKRQPPAPIVQRRPKVIAQRVSPKPARGNCFAFNGERYCQ